ncbi:unnamed protein product, partial [Owenia fusiformis]
LVVIYGVCSTGVACLAMLIKGPVIQAGSTLSGAISGSSSALFILGAFTATSNWKGAITGPVVSFIILLWIAIGGQSIKGNNQYLPPGPTDRCEISNGSSVYNISVYNNVTSLYNDTIDIVYDGNLLNHSSIMEPQNRDPALVWHFSSPICTAGDTPCHSYRACSQLGN